MVSKPKRLRAALYLRCSDVKQDTSIEDQRTSTTDYAASPAHEFLRERGIRIVDEYVDDGISGDETKKRHAFLDMRAAVESGDCGFDIVLCWDQDRFGRFDSLEAGYWIYPFRQAGIKLVTVSDGIVDWDSLQGRILYSVMR